MGAGAAQYRVGRRLPPENAFPALGQHSEKSFRFREPGEVVRVGELGHSEHLRLGAELLLEHLPMHRHLFAQLGRRNQEREGMVVGLREQGNPTRPVQGPQPVDHIGGRQSSLLEERPGQGETEPELGEVIERSVEPVERGPVRALGDPLEDGEVTVDVKIRTPRAQVEEPEPTESPGLMEMEVEHDLQGRTPAARIASR